MRLLFSYACDDRSDSALPNGDGSARALCRSRSVVRLICVGLLIAATCLAALSWLPAPVSAEELDTRLYKLQAAFLFKFSSYVQWPNQDGQAGEPFVIGVVGESQLEPHLVRLSQTKRHGNRPIVFRRVATPAEAAGCHTLFFPPAVDPDIQKAILTHVAGAGVLLVGESRSFLDQGGTIAFHVVNNKLGGHSSQANAARDGLKISAKLYAVFDPID